MMQVLEKDHRQLCDAVEEDTRWLRDAVEASSPESQNETLLRHKY